MPGRAESLVAIVAALAVLAWLPPAAHAGQLADLSLAIRQGELAAVRRLVEADPSLARTPDEAGFTPLHIAATAGRVEIIDYLLQRGAPIEARTRGGQTPLFQTVPLAQARAFEFLLGKGANFAARDDAGRSILQFALHWRRPAMIDLILARGFPLDVRPEHAAAMLQDACEGGAASLVSALLAKGAPGKDATLATTLLPCAARAGLDDFTAHLLATGARPNERDIHGMTPLHLAAFYGRESVVRVLLDGGAQVNARVPDGRTALDIARDGNHAAVVSVLVLHGAVATPSAWPALEGPYLGESEAPDVPRVFAAGLVSSEEHETNLAFHPGGGELCLSRINALQTQRWLLFMRKIGGRWQPPERAPFQSGGTDFECAYSTDGATLFFVSDRATPPGGSRRPDTDVWAVDRTGAGWSEPRNLGPAVNGQSNEYMPSVDRERNLYFERYGLNVARWRDGVYQPAERVPPFPGVSNPGHPFIAPDGSYLLFDGVPEGSSKGVLFAAYRLRDGSWSEAVRLFPGHDAREYESCPAVSPDGRVLFFGRDHDIYWVNASVIDARRLPAR